MTTRDDDANQNYDSFELGLDKFASRRLLVKRIFTFGVGWPLLMYFAFALFIPFDIFEKIPVLKTFANHVANLVMYLRPSWNILNHAKSTSFPQVALLCSAFAMILIPWLIVMASVGMLFGYKYGRLEKNPFSGMRTAQLIFIGAVMLLGVPAGLWVINIFYVVAGDPTIYQGATTTSRFGYAGLSTGAIICAAGCIWMQPFYIFVAIDKLLFGGFKNV